MTRLAVDLKGFLCGLYHDGEISLATNPDVIVDEGVNDLSGVIEIISEMDSSARLHGPENLPDLLPEATIWAAERLADICQFIAFREIPAETIAEHMRLPCSLETGPSTIFSADLVLRYLPDCYILAKGISRDDPLVIEMLEMGHRWPLSSVGIEGLGDVEPGDLIDHPALRQLYVDRIIEHKDISRAQYPLIEPHVRRALGDKTEMLCHPFLQLDPPVVESLPSNTTHMESA